ncbi:hypothetical protein PaeCFBP13512_19730 [Paenibacillus sp. CFBP13512]|uniref:hypothetical protein n=1 Tax=Paenibacillus sp. CFBP13512 TaxID=2184007 RepID=UPI0010C028E5|nr:hypothetical protein [Paenibacillus sp. CFBP13512]TKJ86066.1 hypothetical protein PaeCFBP13512_19730 [Paenibacillus sp. CFBP13512]
MRKQIKDEESWELGKSCGMVRAMQKFMDHYFGQLNKKYFKMLQEIIDLDLVEEINDVIFKTNLEREDFVSTLKLIEQKHMEQMRRNRENV